MYPCNTLWLTLQIQPREAPSTSVLLSATLANMGRDDLEQLFVSKLNGSLMVKKKPLNHPTPDFAMYLADAFRARMAFAFCGAEGMRVLKSTQGLLATLRCRAIFLYPGTDTLSEWLRRWTRNPVGSARKGSNPLGVALLARYVAGVWKPLP